MTPKTSTTEALKLGLGYAKESLDRHDQSFDRHPATEFGRNAILSDIASIEDALASAAPQEVVGWANPAPDAAVPAAMSKTTTVTLQPSQAAGPEVFGWAIVDKDGIERHFSARRQDFFGAVVQVDYLGDEYAERMDLDNPGLAPHRVVPLYTAQPATQAPAQAVAQPLTDEDARRYAYLMDNFIGADFDINGSGTAGLLFKLPSGARVSGRLPDVIDAAIRSSGGEQ
jgi:hypothetical protein